MKIVFDLVRNMPWTERALKLLASCLVYSLIIMTITLVAILFFTRELSQILLFLTYGLLIEGGLAMVTGGATASFSPAIGRVGEAVVHSAPFDAKRLKEAEKRARAWIGTGAFLFLFGLLVSSL